MVTHRTMIRVTVGLAAGLIALISPSGAAAGTLDQQQPNQQATTANETPVGDQHQAAQTFTAGLSGGLDQVDVHVGGTPLPCEPGSGIKVEVRTVTGEAPSDNILATATIPSSSIIVRSWNSVTFATPAPVTAGTRYALVLSAPDSTCTLDPGEALYFWTGADSAPPNPYGAGSAWLRDLGSGPDWMANDPAFDQAFKTYVVPPSTGPTGQRARALKKCAKLKNKAKKKKCKKRARKLPI